MALTAKEARPVEREISIKSGVKGYPDRVFLIKMSGTGLTFREKGKREYRSITFADLARWMVMHAPVRE